MNIRSVKLAPPGGPSTLPPELGGPSSPLSTRALEPPYPLASPAVIPLPTIPVVNAYGKKWYKVERTLKIPFNNRTCRTKYWFVSDPVGSACGPGTDVGRQSSILN